MNNMPLLHILVLICSKNVCKEILDVIPQLVFVSLH